MLRLEDVGPGGSYSTIEDLGKLRAVFQYLHEQAVPFHVATIPRAVYISEDGTRYDKGIDDLNPDQFVRHFIQVLKNAQDRQGALLGMHGYTHQYGDQYRADSWQNTGAGFEFDVEDAPETAEPSYAVERITKSLAAFEKAELTPHFWESPHYNDSREQEEIFRSFMGILYQPDLLSIRSLKDLNVYEDLNVYGKTSLGSVYVPAPLRYIHDTASVDAVLAKLNTYRGLAAMYYHPYLEFPQLESVLDGDGKPVLEDGIPLYRYKADAASNLQHLVGGFRDRHFNWVSLHDVVPFSPAHRIEMPIGTKPANILIGNISGSTASDVVIVRPDGTVDVVEGDYRWPRNRQQKIPRSWLSEPFSAEEQLLLADVNGDKMQDLLAFNRQTGVLRGFASLGFSFEEKETLIGTFPNSQVIGSLQANTDGRADLLVRDGDRLLVVLNNTDGITQARSILHIPTDAVIHSGDLNGDKLDDIISYSPQEHLLRLYKNIGDGTWQPIKETAVTPTHNGTQLLASDTDGDGRTDVIIYDSKNGIWDVWQSNSDFTLTPINNSYGPWAAGARIGYTADFDGNGKADIASYDPTGQVFDISLSFRQKQP